jgi:hypothetical protein
MTIKRVPIDVVAILSKKYLRCCFGKSKGNVRLNTDGSIVGQQKLIQRNVNLIVNGN